MPVRGSIVKRCVYFGLHSPRCHYQRPSPHTQTPTHTPFTHIQTGDFRTMKLKLRSFPNQSLLVTGMSATIAAFHSDAHYTCADIPRERFQSKLRPTQPFNEVKCCGRRGSKWLKVGCDPEFIFSQVFTDGHIDPLQVKLWL